MSHARAVLLVASAIAVALAAGSAALWVNARERAHDARAQRAATKAAAPATQNLAQAEAVQMHFDKPHVRTLPVEMAALGAARFYNQEGRPELAEQQLQRLFSQVPDGGLQSECTVELAIAQCALGKRAEGELALRVLARLSAPMALIDRATTACQREANAKP